MGGKTYSVSVRGETVRSEVPGKYAGHRGYKIFGTLTCKSGMRMNRENRVFFLELEDAVLGGYRPCRLCRPMDEEDFSRMRKLVPFSTLEEFYLSGKQFAKKPAVSTFHPEF